MDTEFHERPCTIELISIAIVREDGRSIYLESSDFDLDKAEKHPFLSQSVLPHLGPKENWIPNSKIAKQIKKFLKDDNKIQFWGYFCNYDWVVFCWLFGTMVQLPSYMPMYCRDLKMLMDYHKVKKEDLPPQKGTAHNALTDALWIRDATEYLLKTRYITSL